MSPAGCNLRSPACNLLRGNDMAEWVEFVGWFLAVAPTARTEVLGWRFVRLWLADSPVRTGGPTARTEVLGQRFVRVWRTLQFKRARQLPALSCSVGTVGS